MKKLINSKYKPLLVLTLLWFTFSVSAFLTVGATVDCDYHNIEDAYNDFGDSTIRVANDKIYSEVFIIERTMSFTGGYNSCADAEINAVSNTRTKWRLGINAEANLVPLSIIGITNFEIYDGTGSAFGSAGGIRVAGNTFVLVNNADIHDNTSEEGGGIRITGSAARVQLNNSTIRDNNASIDGGGVFCEFSASFTMIGDSVIKNNVATFGGGGIFAKEDCQVEVKSGNTALNKGIINNIARRGGGAYLLLGADMKLTGNDDHPAVIAGNRSTLSLEFDVIPLLGGGGVYVHSAGSTFVGTNAYIVTNVAQYHAAGFAVTNGGSFQMKRLASSCWDNDKCSSLSGNFLFDNTNLGSGAAGYMNQFDTNVEITGTFISANKADFVSVIVVGGADSYIKLEGNLISGNRPFGVATAANAFEVRSQNHLDFYYNTYVDNQAFTNFLVEGQISSELNIYNSIIRDQGDILEINGANTPVINVNCNYVHETATLTSATTNIDNFQSNPNFVNVANGDYHLNNESFARDLCANTPNPTNNKDLNGNDRGFDIQGLVNLRGPYDAGAYEFLPFVEEIFTNGFE